jgi:hypothetical protein
MPVAQSDGASLERGNVVLDDDLAEGPAEPVGEPAGILLRGGGLVATRSHARTRGWGSNEGPPDSDPRDVKGTLTR